MENNKNFLKELAFLNEYPNMPSVHKMLQTVTKHKKLHLEKLNEKDYLLEGEHIIDKGKMSHIRDYLLSNRIVLHSMQDNNYIVNESKKKFVERFDDFMSNKYRNANINTDNDDLKGEYLEVMRLI